MFTLPKWSSPPTLIPGVPYNYVTQKMGEVLAPLPRLAKDTLITENFGQFNFRTEACPKFKLSEIFKSEILECPKFLMVPNFAFFQI